LGFISPRRLARALHSSVRVTRRDELLRPYQRGKLTERRLGPPQLPRTPAAPKVRDRRRRERRAGAIQRPIPPPLPLGPQPGTQTVNGASHRSRNRAGTELAPYPPPSNVPGGEC
jgi:hypothetical protein